MILAWFTTYWIHLAVASSLLFLGFAGLYGYKAYKEHAYKKSIKIEKPKFVDCINNAITNEEYQICFNNIEEDK